MSEIEIDKGLWEEFLEFKKWKEQRVGNASVVNYDREHSQMGNKPDAGERNNGDNQRSNNGKNNSRVQNETETVTLQLQPNIPELKEEMEEVECAGCGFKGKYPVGKYPDKCPNCGLKWQ